jgi:uncharacterized protein (DUF924 family)
MTSPTTTDPAAVLHFWFDELSAAQHFAKDAALDAAIAQRFGPTLEAAARGELSGWRASTPGRLAEIVVLDPVLAQRVARHAARLRAGRHGPGAGTGAGGQRPGPRPASRAAGLCLHALHAQRVGRHPRAVGAALRAAGLEGNLRFALQHQAIIERFGRYPHRNAVLGRASTAQELAFLSEPGSSF